MQQEVEMEFGSGVKDLLVPEKLKKIADCHEYKTFANAFGNVQ